MTSKKQNEIDKYLDSVSAFMEEMNSGLYTSIDIKNQIPDRPDFLSIDDEIAIKNVLYDYDVFPKAFHIFKQLFTSHPSHEKLRFELNNEENWCE